MAVSLQRQLTGLNQKQFPSKCWSETFLCQFLLDMIYWIWFWINKYKITNIWSISCSPTPAMYVNFGLEQMSGKDQNLKQTSVTQGPVLVKAIICMIPWSCFEYWMNYVMSEMNKFTCKIDDTASAIGLNCSIVSSVS